MKPMLKLKKEDVNNEFIENGISELKLINLISDDCILCNTLCESIINKYYTEKQNIEPPKTCASCGDNGICCFEKKEDDTCEDYYHYNIEYSQYFIINPTTNYDELIQLHLPFDVYYNETYDIYFIAIQDDGTNRDFIEGLKLEELKKVFDVKIEE